MALMKPPELRNRKLNRRNQSTESFAKGAPKTKLSPRENLTVETSTKVELPRSPRGAGGGLGNPQHGGGGLLVSPRGGDVRAASPRGGGGLVISPRGGAGGGGDLSGSQNSSTLPPLVNVPAKQTNYNSIGSNTSMLGLSARVEKEKAIKQQERGLLAEKAAAMVARAEREHSAIIQRKVEVKAKKEREEKEAAEKAKKKKEEGPFPR